MPGPSQPASIEQQSRAAFSSLRVVHDQGLDLSYREAGAGRPVVCIHGLGVSADYWVRFACALAARGLRALALNLPGYGGSPGPLDLPLGQQVAVIARFASALGLERLALVGHSQGCHAALEAARALPWLVSTVVLASPTGDRCASAAQQIGAWARNAWRESWAVRRLCTRAYLQAGPRRIYRAFREGLAYDAVAAARSIGQPALVVRGALDPVVAPAFAEQLARVLPHGSKITLEGGTHALNHRQGPELAEATSLLLSPAGEHALAPRRPLRHPEERDASLGMEGLLRRRARSPG